MGLLTSIPKSVMDSIKNYILNSIPPAPSSPYKVYTALLNQTGATPPVATVLENTIGVISFSYVETGTYRISSSNLFTSNKTMIITSSFLSGTGFMVQVVNLLNNAVDNTESSLIVKANTSSGGADDKLFNTPIEIRVYN